MPFATLAMLASAVTLAGLAATILLAQSVASARGRRARPIALAMLLTYLGIFVWRPSPWPALIDAAVVAGAAGAALLIEAGLSTPASVAVFLGVAAVVDVASMSGGLTRVLLDSYRAGTSDLLLYLTLVVPVGGRTVPVVGIGDLIVGGAAGLALMRLGYRRGLVLATLSGGLLAALAWGLLRRGAPAVPFIAVAVGLLVWLRRAPTTAARTP